MKTDPNTLGWNAFMDGEGKDKNPFEKNTDDHKAWLESFEKAEAECVSFPPATDFRQEAEFDDEDDENEIEEDIEDEDE